MFLNAMKYGLTQVGKNLSPQFLNRIQSSVNYLKIGRWMCEHQFVLNNRVQYREAVWQAILERVRGRKVLYLEFGVSSGASMQYWSRELKHPDAMLRGFDSFEGLPEEGGPWQKGQFSTGGSVPYLADPRVQFIKGWFDQTLPSFSVPPHEVLVINMDADIYSSTILVLRQLRPHIRKGTCIYFDEMSVVDHEPRAFEEFLRESGLKFKPISADKSLTFVAFECV